jgi:hypothetical protein
LREAQFNPGRERLRLPSIASSTSTGISSGCGFLAGIRERRTISFGYSANESGSAKRFATTKQATAAAISASPIAELKIRDRRLMLDSETRRSFLALCAGAERDAFASEEPIENGLCILGMQPELA